MWQYAYHLVGEKKIGKTTFAVEGCDAMVLQFDKPSLAYDVMEVCIKDWDHFKSVLAEFKERVAKKDFPWDRIVIDGVGEWYQMMERKTCKHFGIQDPSDEAFGKGWRYFRNGFADAVNELLRLQPEVGAGLIFISHSEWKEVKTRGGGKVDKMVANLPARAEEMINGKCDGWFVYDYDGDDRVLTIQGSETIGAGHRIDGHFRTADGRRIREIVMGKSAAKALQSFSDAFSNKQSYATVEELRSSAAAGKPAKPANKEHR